MQINKLDLLSKGWSTNEIEHVSTIIEEAENKKHIGIKFLDKTIYWALLFLLIVGNAICSAFLIPFLFVFKGTFIIFIITVFGFAFGVFFSILIADIHRAEKRSLSGLLFALIISGVVNFALISRASIEFSIKTMLPLRHNPYLIAGIYLFAFLTPHIVLMIAQYQKQ